MIEELENAGNAFRAALDQYLSVCLKIGELSLRPGVLRNTPQRHLDAIHSEIAYFSSYESKLRQVEAAARRIRNHLPEAVPIASLPNEILIHIFQLVAKPCNLIVPHYGDSESDKSINPSGNSKQRHEKACSQSLEKFPTYLDNLTHVCSDWRKTAISCPSLWTHIDIIAHESFHLKLLARARTYVARAAQLPLELHFADVIPFNFNGLLLRIFLSSTYHRVESLNIAVVHNCRKFYDCIFDELFSPRASRPNIFTKLTTHFPMANDRFNEFDVWPGSTNSFHFTTLHLRGLFPPWDSGAYSNLIDLRLTASRDERWAGISESQLRGILVASPRLRIFHFALKLTDWQPDDESVLPVRLDDLEILSINTYRAECRTVVKLGHVLRLISPGSKPLQLAISHDFYTYGPTNVDIYEDDFSTEELARFFQRSNITDFCSKYQWPYMDRLLGYATNLQNLTLTSYIIGLTSGSSVPAPSATTSPLNSFTLHRCVLSLAALEVLLQQRPTNLLILSKCKWIINDTFLDWDPIGEISELLQRYPVTKATFKSLSTSADWALID
ncbi:hypothetical protein RSOLAG22IIIB_11256 [Rhizoctonia solani]|uniref:Uncharacterized protein n=1 Tax=Rhizoctonia solani TaxID=456999 RepID=A0A0K6G837_9AGAM|nr:hypothetical protein RSOLAG22IIIB_11256 [Rhizoctonia solani]